MGKIKEGWIHTYIYTLALIYMLGVNISGCTLRIYKILSTYLFRYVEHVAKYGGMVEVRTARHTQHLPIFVRMLDKNSRWGYDNGLKSMVTTLLQFSMTGYPFVLPDMVGGNGYLGVPSRELYIRWMQVFFLFSTSKCKWHLNKINAATLPPNKIACSISIKG